MATAVQRARTIVEALLGKTVTNAMLERVVLNYINYDITTDGDLTNEQKANRFIVMLRNHAKQKVKVGAMQIEERQNLPNVVAAGNGALDDLKEETT